ncbi:transposase [Vibrio rhizosphaerae]|uniref:Transposase n=1 Tax=Vibrio rhizosphaerae TaxID=398736 RepID=A0ABU4IUR5_9VIBR|nr:transposase [Vibrio rhizosphaerae]MDW6093152.1 transposase [Vibrio rhizosphaerae]
MRPETLLAKFNLKGMNYQAMHQGGRSKFSVEEQLAMVGVSWKSSPIGFLVLFVETQDCRHSRQALEKEIQSEIATLTQNWRGQRSESAFAAMVDAAIEEATHPQGTICSSCGGTGLYKTSHRQMRKCTHCEEGRVLWRPESRYVAMCSRGFICSYPIFKRYNAILEELSQWLAAKRNAAMLTLIERIEREEEAYALMN